jgi:hypothetical protein
LPAAPINNLNTPPHCDRHHKEKACYYLTLAYSLINLSHKHKGCLKNRGNKMSQTTAVIYFASVLLIASPFVIDTIKQDRKVAKRKVAKRKVEVENFAVEDFWATN